MTDAVEARVSSLEGRVDKVEDVVTDVNKTLNTFQLALVREMSEANSKIEKHISAVVAVTGENKIKIESHDQRIDHIDDDIDRFRGEIGKLTLKVTGLVAGLGAAGWGAVKLLWQ